ncbi:MAG: thiosulfohydrolase SoxB, partial [Hyphomicrobium sp.]
DRITDLTVLKTKQPLDAAKEYVVAGWASVNQGTEGPPIWEVIAKHIENKKTIAVEENTSVKIVGA